MPDTNHTPEWVYTQAYQDSIYERVDFRPGWSSDDRPVLYSQTYGRARTNNNHVTLKLKFQGKFVEAKVKYMGAEKRHSIPRGKIHDFSKQSRGRLIDITNSLDLRGKAVFLTLTYGGEYPNAQSAKAHLRAFLERIRRRYPEEKISAIWRMEFQERGAPHFHIVFFNLPYIPKQTIQNWWQDITGHIRPFTRIELIYSHKKLLNYVAKYVAKVNPSEDSGFNTPTYLHAYAQKYDENIGRLWGTFNKQHLPFAECVLIDIPLNMRNYVRFRALACQKFPPIADYQALGFRLYVPDARWWLNAFHDIYDIMF